VTRSHRHSACWPRLTTSKTLQVFHLEKIARNSLFRNTLPLSPTRSRFCRASCKTTEWFQDFRGIPGGGGTLPSAPEYVQERCIRNCSQRLLLSKQEMDRRLPMRDQRRSASGRDFQSCRKEPLVKDSPPASSAERARHEEEMIGNAISARPRSCPGAEPSLQADFSAASRAALYDRQLIFHRIPRRRTGNPQRRCIDRLRRDRSLRKLF